MVDLSRLAVAAEAFGIECFFYDQGFYAFVNGASVGWEGESEDAAVAFAFRDAVRKKDRSCICCQLPSGMHEVWYGDLTGSYPEGDNETQAWANALIALHDLGVKQ